MLLEQQQQQQKSQSEPKFLPIPDPAPKKPANSDKYWTAAQIMILLEDTLAGRSIEEIAISIRRPATGCQNKLFRLLTGKCVCPNCAIDLLAKLKQRRAKNQFDGRTRTAAAATLRLKPLVTNPLPKLLIEQFKTMNTAIADTNDFLRKDLAAIRMLAMYNAARAIAAGEPSEDIWRKFPRCSLLSPSMRGEILAAAEELRRPHDGQDDGADGQPPGGSSTGGAGADRNSAETNLDGGAA